VGLSQELVVVGGAGPFDATDIDVLDGASDANSGDGDAFDLIALQQGEDPSGDVDTNGIPDPSNGNALVKGSVTFNTNTNMVEYEPPAGVFSTVGDPDTYDSFTYTIQDGKGGIDWLGNEKADTVTVTVIVLSGDVVVTRSFPRGPRLQYGTDVADNDGMDVTLTVTFASQGARDALTTLRIHEFTPISGNGSYDVDDIANVVVSPASVDVAVTKAADSVGDQAGAIVFDVDEADLEALGSTELVLTITYHLISPGDDRLNEEIVQPKSYCADDCGLFYTATGGDETELLTEGDGEFAVVEVLATLDVDGDGAVLTKDLILISRKINLVDPFGFDLLAPGQTLTSITEQEVKDNITALEQGGLDVDEDGAILTKDLILISRKINLVDPFGFDLLAPGQTLDGITEQEVKDNITKIQP
jgi:hypothetical protein